MSKNNKLSPVRPHLFESKYIRYDPSIYVANDLARELETVETEGFIDPLLNETYGGLVSTQQIPIDYSDFTNFVFFDSAVSKINIGFEKLISDYPFDSNSEEINKFLDSLTGYEKHLLTSFPNFKNFLNFDNSLENFISIKDSKSIKNYLFEPTSGNSVLSPRGKSFTVEFHLYLPEETNDCQTIFQIQDSDHNAINIALSESNSTSTGKIVFDVVSGSSLEFSQNNVTYDIEKGKFKHLSFHYSGENENLKIISDGVEVAKSNNTNKFNDLFYKQATVLIGSGSKIRGLEGTVPNDATHFVPKETFSGSIDEFRYFHTDRSLEKIKKLGKRNVFINPTDPASLQLYFRFNEPTGSYASNNFVLDFSGNGLHSKIQNYDDKVRIATLSNPMNQEKSIDNIVLFSKHPDVIALNENLLVSGANYDAYNPNLITKLIPQHYFLDGQIFDGLANITGSLASSYNSNFPGSSGIGSGQILTSFLLIFAKYFDELKIYIDAFSRLRSVRYNNNKSVPPNFLPFAAKKHGITLPNIFNSGLDQFKNKLEIDGLDTISERSLFEIQNEMWKRIAISTRELNSKKGTRDSVKSLIRSIGIDPDLYFDIKEYGGPRRKFLTNRRKSVKKTLNYLDFSGSLATISDIENVDNLGFHQDTPRIISPFLTSSRYEIGYPEAAGTFVNKRHGFPHGESNNRLDGMHTRGSFTFDGMYRFDSRLDHPTSQSLARIFTTGSDVSGVASKQALLFNLVSLSGSFTGLKLFADPNVDKKNVENLFDVKLPGPDLLNGNDWHVGFGYIKDNDHTFNDRGSENLPVTASIFVACTDIDLQKSYYATGALHRGHGSTVDAMAHANLNANYNESGSFFIIGSQSIQNANSYGSTQRKFLNKGLYDEVVRSSNFTGQVNFIRFFSKALTEKDLRERGRNIYSRGVENPNKNYNHNVSITGSFNKLRVDASIAYQTTTASDDTGKISIFDNSQNGFHLSGSGFELNKRIIKKREYVFNILSPKFDENQSEDKVRIRSFKNKENIDSNEYSRPIAVHRVPEKDSTKPDNRFSIDLSSIKSLDEDIMKLFNSHNYFDDVLGDPRTLYETSYKNLIHIRQIYFSDLIQKIDLQSNMKFFNWFDECFTQLIHRFIPMRANFLGVNYVIEPHVLERSRYRYNFDDQYSVLSKGRRVPEREQIERSPGDRIPEISTSPSEPYREITTTTEEEETEETEETGETAASPDIRLGLPADY